MSNQVVKNESTPLSFNSKYSSLEEMVKDEKYCKWLMEQVWFRKREEYKLLSLGIGSTEFKQAMCKRHDWVKGKYVDSVYYGCMRTWCVIDRSCCFRPGHKYTCSLCGAVNEFADR